MPMFRRAAGGVCRRAVEGAEGLVAGIKRMRRGERWC